MNKTNNLKDYTDENVVRLIAAQVTIIAAVSLWQAWFFPFLFLALDFALRAFVHKPVAPLAIIARAIVRLFKLTHKAIFAPPKRFAAGIGFVFSLSIAALLSMDYFIAMYVVGGVLIFCAVLESAFKICIGCYVYGWVVAPIVNRKNSNSFEMNKTAIN